jgi:predicted nucleic acid-binding protein
VEPVVDEASITDLDHAIAEAERILLDTSALIAFHNETELVHTLCKHLFSRIEQRDDPLRGFYSVISVSELLVRPLRAGPAQHAYMHTFLTSFPNLTILPVDLPVAMQAATVRANADLRLPDAIIVASGLLAGCQVIVSNDEAWRRRLAPLFPQFHWLYLGDYL